MYLLYDIIFEILLTNNKQENILEVQILINIFVDENIFFT